MRVPQIGRTGMFPNSNHPASRTRWTLVKQAVGGQRSRAKWRAISAWDRRRPTTVIGFLTEMKAWDGKVTGFQWLSSMDANGMLIDGVLVSTLKDGSPRNRLALLTPDENGKWQLDFDAFARKVNPSWSELMEGNAKRGLVRVVVARKHYYNFNFKDESQWLCYEMTTPDFDEILFGYCRKGSPQAEAMGRIVTDEEMQEGGRFGNRATLEIRRNEGSESRQFEITRVLAEDWVLGEAAFDGSFQ